MLLGVWTVLLSPTSVRADGPADGAIPYDDGVQFAPAPIDSFGDRVAALAVRFFTDCAPGDIGSCGGPPGRWPR